LGNIAIVGIVAKLLEYYRARAGNTGLTNYRGHSTMADSILLHQKQNLWMKMTKLALVSAGAIHPFDNLTWANIGNNASLIEQYPLEFFEKAYQDGSDFSRR
jgi:hypothetical protein